MTDRLPPQLWMNTAAVKRVLAALGAPQVDVRFVGGCVRNAVMGVPIADVDIATPEVPERVMERLAAAGLKAVPTGLSHGTVTAVAEGKGFEVTTLRRDTATDGRHAVVEFSADWHEDARRRDFTFNALSMRSDGTVFDDHDGVAHAKAGRVCFVGDPADRIKEDYLRVLRLFRFQAQFGREPIAPAILAACRAHREGLRILSVERIQHELAKMLAADDPAPAVDAMFNCGVGEVVLPEARNPRGLVSLGNVERKTDTPPLWLRRLAMLTWDEGAAVGTAQRLKFANADRDRLQAISAAAPKDDAGLDRALYRQGSAIVTDRLLLAWARDPDGASHWRAMLEEVADWKAVSFPVSGSDVLALGVAPGPPVGQALAAVEDWWIAQRFRPGREAALAELRAVVDHQRPKQ